MGQQPSVHLRLRDLPRATDHPGAPRRWSPERPGDATGPDFLPRRGRFGAPGPDTGYAWRLLEGRHIAVADGERREDAVAAVAAVMAARASALGRAPVADDAAIAERILGYGLEPSDGAASSRPGAVAGLARHPGRARALVAAIGRGILTAPVERFEDLAASGEVPVRL